MMKLSYVKIIAFGLLAAAAGCASDKAQGVAAATGDANEVSQSVTIKGVRYIGVTVSDIDDTLAFYDQAVDFDVVKRYRTNANDYHDALLSDAEGDIEIALLKMTNVYLQLTDFDPDIKEAPAPRPVIGPGYTHICFISPATNSAYPKFRAAGLDMVSRGDKPVDIGGYGMLYAYGRDPDGAMIETEIASKPRRPDDYWIGHVANVTPHIDRMIDFYADMLGYGARRRTEQENHPRLDDIVNIDNIAIKGGWFAVKNMELEFWHYERPATPERQKPATLDEIGYNSVAFEVDNLNHEIARLTGLGVTFIGEPSDHQGWRVAYAYDPDGNIFSLQENMSADPSESIDDLLWIDPATF